MRGFAGPLAVARMGSSRLPQKRSAAHAARAAALSEDVSRAKAAAATAERAAAESQATADALAAELRVAKERADAAAEAADALRAERSTLRDALAKVGLGCLPLPPSELALTPPPLLGPRQANADVSATTTATRSRTAAWLAIVRSKFDGLAPAPPPQKQPQQGGDDPTAAEAIALLESLPPVRAWFERNAAALEQRVGTRLSAMHEASVVLLGRLAAAEAALAPLREKAQAAEAAAAAADGRVERTRRLLDSASAEGQSLAARRCGRRSPGPAMLSAGD